jgi:hypothetical protein
MQNQETWKPVPVTPFHEAYEINPAGMVRSTKTGKVLKPGRPNSSSPFVILASKQVDGGRHPYTVSKLVKLAFGEGTPEPEPARVVDWESTKSMLSELNYQRGQAGKSALARWSKSKAELKKEIEKYA